MGKLYLVGVGPGSPDYITAAAQKAVEAAHVVVGAQRSLNLFSNAIKGESVALTAKNVDSALKYAADAAQAGKVVAVLSTGDPGFSGLLGSMLRRSLNKTVKLTVVAGVSSLQVAAARLCLSWDEAVFFAFHDQIDPEKKQSLIDAVKAGKTVLVLPEPNVFSPSDISVYMLNAGLDAQMRVVVCENLTLPNERIIESTLNDASKQRFASLSVMVIQPKTTLTLSVSVMWSFKTSGVPDELFLQMTLYQVQPRRNPRITISKARLHENSVVVDVGCGTGGLTVEAALQASKGKVYAFDQDSVAVKLTQSNVEKFGLHNVEVTQGAAPDVLAALPMVDAVLVGGSQRLMDVVSAAFQKLNPNGRIVVNAILLETASAAIAALKTVGFKDIEAVEVFVAKGKAVPAGTMMLARNPITIISATKEL